MKYTLEINVCIERERERAYQMFTPHYTDNIKG